MVNTCVKEIPKDLQASTPIILKATAGLRLLQEGQADNILNEVLKCISLPPPKF
jgi:Golgi nucleoside diphosphatase